MPRHENGLRDGFPLLVENLPVRELAAPLGPEKVTEVAHRQDGATKHGIAGGPTLLLVRRACVDLNTPPGSALLDGEKLQVVHGRQGVDAPVNLLSGEARRLVDHEACGWLDLLPLVEGQRPRHHAAHVLTRQVGVSSLISPVVRLVEEEFEVRALRIEYLTTTSDKCFVCSFAKTVA